MNHLSIAAAQSFSVAGDVRSNAQRHLRFAELAAAQRVQLVVFPELSLTGYELALAKDRVVAADDSALQPLRSLAAHAGLTIVVGAPVMGRSGTHIGALAFSPDGSALQYTKVHVHESEMPHFAAGDGGPLIHLGDSQVALAICRDAAFPEHASRAAQSGAGLYVASVMIDEADYLRKSKLLAGYALGHSMPILMANYSGETGGMVSAGRSTIWSEGGSVVAASSAAEECLVIARRQNGAWSGTVIPLTGVAQAGTA